MNALRLLVDVPTPLAKRLLHAFVALVLLGSTAAAQDSTRPWQRPNVLKTNLLAPVSLFYERALTPRFALRASARWLAFRGSDAERFVNATVEGKFYLASLARLRANAHPSGLFLNPYLKVRSRHVTERVGLNPDVYAEEQIRSLGFGLTAGYQWVFRRGFVLELFHGAGMMPPALSRYRRTRPDGTVTTDLTNAYLTMDVRTGVALGYAF